jgi:hypothetical protein
MRSNRLLLHGLVLIMVLAVSVGVQAQNPQVTLQSNATSPGNGTEVQLAPWGGIGFGVVASGTFTIVPEASYDGGVTWHAVLARSLNSGTEAATITAAGPYTVSAPGAVRFRTRISSCTACNVTVTGRMAAAVIARAAAGGGGGAVTSVFGRTGAVSAAAGDYQASLITNTPAGQIAATTVQAAINELDTEKAATAHTHAAADVTTGVLQPARVISGTITSSRCLRVDATGAIVVHSADCGTSAGGPVTYYVAPAGLTTCTYNGDAGQACSPSDTNDGLTKATPFATIARARDVIQGRLLTAPVVIQLADTTAGTCYQPNRVIFDNPAAGGSGGTALSVGSQTLPDAYPAGYIHIRGNEAAPNNVSIVGATTCAGTASSTLAALAFIGTNARLSGVHLKYFKFGVQGLNATIYMESMNGTSDNPAPAVIDASAVNVDDRSVLHAGGSISITNWIFATVNGNSLFDTRTPAGYLSLTYTSSGGERAMLMNEGSHGYNQGGTFNFSGTGNYRMFEAIANSHWNWQSDITTTITINAPNAVMLRADQGSFIFETCESTNTVCTFIALGQRAVARRGSYIQYNGTATGGSPDFADSGSVIANGTFPYVPIWYGAGGMRHQLEAAQMQWRATVAGDLAFQALVINAERARGFLASPAAVASGDDLVTLSGTGHDGTTFITGGSIRIAADGAWSGSSRPGRIEFRTHAADASTTNATLTMRGATNTVAEGMGAAVASAATITPTGNVFHVTGTAAITSISATNISAGTRITLIFDSTASLTDGGNLRLNGNFSATTDDTITLVFDGTNWYEMSRSQN